MYGYIYETTNTNNGMRYVGQKKGKFNPNYYGSGIHLRLAIDKYGKDTFSIKVISYADCKKQLDEMEKSHIKTCREIFGDNNLYNIADGGEGGAIWFGPHSPEAKEKIKQGKLSYKFSGRHLENLRKSAKHRVPVTDETKEKHRKNWLGDKNPTRCGEANTKGTLWIVHSLSKKTKRIDNDVLLQYTSNGWLLGRK